MISKFELKMTLKSSQCASVDFSENIILNWKCSRDVLRLWMPRSGRCSNAHASSSNIHLLKNFHGNFELILFYSIHIYVVESKRGSSSWDPSRRDGSKDRDEGDHRLLDQTPGVSKGREGGGSCLRNVRYKTMSVVSASTRKLLVPEGNSFCYLLFLFSCLQLISQYKAYHTVDV